MCLYNVLYVCECPDYNSKHWKKQKCLILCSSFDFPFVCLFTFQTSLMINQFLSGLSRKSINANWLQACWRLGFLNQTSPEWALIWWSRFGMWVSDLTIFLLIIIVPLKARVMYSFTQSNLQQSQPCHKHSLGLDVFLTLFCRLLHAVPEQREEEELSVLQQELISGLAELYQTSQGTDNKRGKKRMPALSQFLRLFLLFLTKFVKTSHYPFRQHKSKWMYHFLFVLCYQDLNIQILFFSVTIPIFDLQVVPSAHQWNRRWRPWAARCRCWMWPGWMWKPKRTKLRPSSWGGRAKCQKERGRDAQVTETNLGGQKPSVSISRRTLQCNCSDYHTALTNSLSPQERKYVFLEVLK